MSKLDQTWANVSVSTATLREEDLIPAFEQVLDSAGVSFDRPASADKLLAGKALLDEEWEDVAYYLNETLFDLLNEIAPEGTYFGSHPGDGADFGFWSFDEEE